MSDQSFLNVPAKLKYSGPQGSVRYLASRHNVDLSDSEHLPLVKDLAIAPAIVLLDQLACPAAIGRKVPQVGVYAIKRMFVGRSISHVFDEHREVFPLITDRNSSSAINGVIGVVGVGAPAPHSRPRHVVRRMASAVRNRSADNSFRSQTSARSSHSTLESKGGSFVKIPTIAPAKPKNSFAGSFACHLQNKKTTKLLVGNINDGASFRHLFDVSELSH